MARRTGDAVVAARAARFHASRCRGTRRTRRSTLHAVLVANRGEIAWRILRACTDLRIAGVAVYSEADRDAPWLRAADDAFLLGPASAAESYLSIDRILDVAARAGVDAVHPGYGFLSENADFARAVTDAGLVWVGPPHEAIALMGDKISARKTAEAAGVPLVPGTTEPTEDPAEVAAFAERHGFPVAIKAAFGGGGRGLKVVRDGDGLSDALEAARREATAAFGRGEVYVERYLARPRHIEAQILADGHGRPVFLGERDCSAQRRHQKLIEEAPAPNFPEDVRIELGEAAVRIAEQVDYVGAGTVEFLYADGAFYFLEMNTRLQVEHPVTERVTGVDLVTSQLRIARGERLALGDATPRGHAIEVRVNAEDPAADFAPSPGTITDWVPPAGPGVRVDAGVEAGWTVPGAYDSLLAKLVVWGADRQQARERLRRAIDEFRVEGVPTTLPFHRFAVDQPDFAAGRVATVSVEHEWDLSSLARQPPAVASAQEQGPSRTLVVEVDGRRLEVALFEPDQPRGGRRRRAGPGHRAGAAAGGGAEEVLTAPMQGTVVKTAVEQGDDVAVGDLVLVLEAMKMENHITAHRDGTIAELAVAAGDVVNTGDRLALIRDVT